MLSVCSESGNTKCLKFVLVLLITYYVFSANTQQLVEDFCLALSYIILQNMFGFQGICTNIEKLKKIKK